MSISREELIDILTVVSFLVHAEREIHISEKKVLFATFKAAGITPEEQEKMKSNTSLEEKLKNIQSPEAKHALVELMALVAAADGDFEEEEKVIIKKINLNQKQTNLKRPNLQPQNHKKQKKLAKSNYKLYKLNESTYDKKNT